MVPPSTTLKPAGTPSLAEWASTFQCALPRTCKMPFRSGLRYGVRGPLYAEAVWAAGGRGGVAPRCACATPAAIPVVSKTRPVAAPMVMIGFFILTRESLPHGPAFGERRPHVNCGEIWTRFIRERLVACQPSRSIVSEGWSGLRGSNPCPRLGKPLYYHCTKPASDAAGLKGPPYERDRITSGSTRRPRRAFVPSAPAGLPPGSGAAT